MKQLWVDIRLLWKHKTGFKLASLYILMIVLVAAFAPILPLPYQPNELDLVYSFKEPFDWKGLSSTHKHWLGTDALGRDVLVNIIFGARSSLFVSVPVMVITSLIGLTLGTLAGYFRDSGLALSKASAVVLLITLLLIVYLGISIPFQVVQLELGITKVMTSLATLLIALLLLWTLFLPALKKMSALSRKFMLPVDYLTMRLIEAITSIPSLLLILVIVSFLPPSIMLLSLVLVATLWTSTARLARAEIMKISTLPYFEAARSLGLNQSQLLLKHALPNMLVPILTTFTFGLAGLLALESTLSFLGIGVPNTFVSWGRTIAGIRSNTSAWWLVVFPGLTLTTTVLALQTISHHILKTVQRTHSH